MYFQDGHEICFVGDEAFRELSQVDPKADQLIDEVSNIESSLSFMIYHLLHLTVIINKSCKQEAVRLNL